MICYVVFMQDPEHDSVHVLAVRNTMREADKVADAYASENYMTFVDSTDNVVLGAVLPEYEQ